MMRVTKEGRIFVEKELKTHLNKYGHWKTKTQFNPEQYFGFIYLITNKLSGMWYIGKKQLKLKNKYKVNQKGNKKKKKTKIVYVESGWESYTSSSFYVNEDIKKFGISNFSFEIISLHKSKSSLYYQEVHELVTRGALVNRVASGERVSYNRAIPGVKFIPLVD